MPNMGPIELIVLGVIALVLFIIPVTVIFVLLKYSAEIVIGGRMSRRIVWGGG